MDITIGTCPPHWKQWYWRTKAHNAITFDGGKGQAEKISSEKIIRHTRALFRLLVCQTPRELGGLELSR